MVRDLIDLLKQRNFDDRAEKIGYRHSDIAGAALEGIGHRRRRPGKHSDVLVLWWGLKNLPPAEITGF
ncbi:hypothetical protein L0Y49_03180 [bacterium]|nr:hypothetical protein [bacterium]